MVRILKVDANRFLNKNVKKQSNYFWLISIVFEKSNNLASQIKFKYYEKNSSY